MFKNMVKYKPTRILVVIRPFCNTNVLKSIKKNSRSTKDEAEILHFQKLSDIWWKKDGELKGLHSMNDVRVPFIREGLKKRGMLNSEFVSSNTPLKNLNIIDVGCGGGILSEPLSQLGANVTGIDASERLIEIADKHSTNNPELRSKINYIHGAVEDIVSTDKNRYDVVVTSECVEHVAEPEIFLNSCADILKPGGSLFLTTINRTTLSWLIAIQAYENILNHLPKGTHDWNKFMTPREVTQLLKKNNCQTIEEKGFIYNYFSNKWSWTSNTSIFYALHAIKKV